MSREEYEAQIGRVLRDKWTLERLIGVGGMAAVYIGRHKIGRTAAIKVLHPEIAMEEQVRARFEQEAFAVNSIGHPGVVEILDVDTAEDGSHYLVMELLEGETLADRVEREGCMPFKPMIDVVDKVLDVLIACHRKGIVHRDIKPENLFLLKTGGLKVLDFGIARVRAGVRTMAGTMLGTVAFMPPEQIKGVDVDHRADLFAVGATIFTSMAGRPIHLTETDAQLASRMLTVPAPEFAKIMPDESEALALMVDRALAFLPERRYPDALTMRGDVWAVRRGERPPYANACEAAGQSSRDVKLNAGEGKRKIVVESTKPQMPAFTEPLAGAPGKSPAGSKSKAAPRRITRADAGFNKPAAPRPAVKVASKPLPKPLLPSTKPQLPTVDDAAAPAAVAPAAAAVAAPAAAAPAAGKPGPSQVVPSTQPQLPAFVAEEAPGGGPMSVRPASVRPASVAPASAAAVGPGPVSAAAVSIAPSSAAPASEAADDAASASAAPVTVPPVSVAPASEAGPASGVPSSSVPATTPSGPAPVDTSAAADASPEPASEESEALEVEAAPPSVAPESEPPSIVDPSKDPASLKAAKSSNLWVFLLFLLLIALGLGGAWYAGLIDFGGGSKPQRPKPVPSAAPKPAAPPAPATSSKY